MTEKKEMLILLAEDDLNLGLVTQDLLKAEGYQVHLCRDGKDGLHKFNENNYSLCLLDVMMPKKDGFSLAEDIRKINPSVPIIFLTAREMPEDKIRGFRAGADDYITKPFEPQEFLLRIKALLKRAKGHVISAEDSNKLKIGTYTFDTANFELSSNQSKRTLTRKEAEILKIIASKKGQLVERELMTNLIWGDDNYFVGRSMDVFISKLRKYFSEDHNIRIINVHGVGFKLEDTSED